MWVCLPNLVLWGEEIVVVFVESVVVGDEEIEK